MSSDESSEDYHRGDAWSSDDSSIDHGWRRPNRSSASWLSSASPSEQSGSGSVATAKNSSASSDRWLSSEDGRESQEEDPDLENRTPSTDVDNDRFDPGKPNEDPEERSRRIPEREPIDTGSGRAGPSNNDSETHSLVVEMENFQEDRAKKRRRRTRQDREARREAKVARGKERRDHFYGELQEYSIQDTPNATPPFYHDVLSVILLFLSADAKTQLAAASVCQTWRFFSNYLPAWQHLTVASKQVLVRTSARRRQTRNQLFLQAKEERERFQRNRTRRRAIGSLHQVSYLLVFGAVLTAMWFVSWAIGHDKNILDNDGKVGTMSFFAVVMIFFTVVLPIVECFSDDRAQTREFHRGSLIVGTLVISIILGPIIALIGIRTQVAEFMQSVPSFPLATVPFFSCAHWAHMSPEAYLKLPAPLENWTLNNTEPTTEGKFRIASSSLESSGTSSGSETSAPSSTVSYVSLPSVVPTERRGILNLRGSTLFFAHVYYHFAYNATAIGTSSEHCGPRNSSHARVDLAVTAQEISEIETFVNYFTSQLATSANTTASPPASGAWIQSSRFQRALKSERDFRSYFGFPYYGLTGIEEKWFSTTNELWRDRKAYLLNLDFPESAADRQARVDTLYYSLHAITITGGVFAVFFFALTCWPSRNGTECGFKISLITLVVFINPVVFIMWGTICIVGHQERLAWTMCDDTAGYGLISIGIVFGIWLASAICSD